jgi:hypothetical protein
VTNDSLYSMRNNCHVTSVVVSSFASLIILSFSSLTIRIGCSNLAPLWGQYNYRMSASICPVCNKRKREKGRTRQDGTIWYRPLCRLCRKNGAKIDDNRTKEGLIKEIELLRRYKKAMEVLCKRQYVDIDDVLKKYAPEKNQ